MSKVNTSKKQKLCTIWVRENMLAAEKEAQKLFEAYPDFINKELKYTGGEPIDRLKEIYRNETVKYDRQLDIEDSKSAEEQLIKFFVGNKEICDDNLSINEYGTLGQYERLVGQFFTSLKLKLLQSLIYEQKVLNDQSINGLNQPKYPRIKWNGNVSEFGYIILLLHKKEYIDLPIGPGSEESYSLLAKILFKTFDVTESFESLRDALNPNSNRLGITKRKKLEDFPDDLIEFEQLGKINNSKSRK